jgi:hypothetical protein
MELAEVRRPYWKVERRPQVRFWLRVSGIIDNTPGIKTYTEKYVWVYELTEDAKWVKQVQDSGNPLTLGESLCRFQGSKFWHQEQRKNQAKASHGKLKPVDDTPVSEGDNDAANTRA